MRVTRIGKVFNYKGQPGLIDVSRSKGYADFVLTDANDPNIPDTDIPRLRLTYLGGKSRGISDDEIARVVSALEDFHASKIAKRGSATGSSKKQKQKPPHLGEAVR